ncbi:MAG TPA: glycosyltransferase family 2 protein [Rhizomicrobium sp.]
MKFSIVTISYNQAEFLEQTIRSVLDQDYDDIEYIVVDPGSTDGSREIIERYRERISTIIFEPDRGAADGLNKGFAHAHGDIYGFLNSDDVLLPGAIRRAAAYFRARPETEILMGHEWIIDSEGRKVRKAYTDRFNARAFAYSAGVIAQQSTFFRAGLFKRTKGFDTHLTVYWDGELFLDLLEATEKQLYADDFFGAFRIHGESITGGQKLEDASRAYELARFERIMGRRWRRSDHLVRLFYRVRKYILEPRALMEWLRYGSINKGL